MNSLENIFHLYKKDLLLELRTKITLLSVCLFSFLVLLIFNFGFKIVDVNVDKFAPGILWITFSFAGILALQRIFDHERERWALKGLIMSPVSSFGIYMSKFMLHLTVMFVLEAVTIVLFLIFFNPAWNLLVFLKIFFISFVATFGFSAVGVLISSMLFNERLKDLLMPLIFYPIIIPLIIMSVKSFETVIAGEGMHLVYYILGFDGVFIIASAMLYDYVIEGE